MTTMPAANPTEPPTDPHDDDDDDDARAPPTREAQAALQRAARAALLRLRLFLREHAVHACAERGAARAAHAEVRAAADAIQAHVLPLQASAASASEGSMTRGRCAALLRAVTVDVEALLREKRRWWAEQQQEEPGSARSAGSVGAGGKEDGEGDRWAGRAGGTLVRVLRELYAARQAQAKALRARLLRSGLVQAAALLERSVLQGVVVPVHAKLYGEQGEEGGLRVAEAERIRVALARVKGVLDEAERGLCGAGREEEEEEEGEGEEREVDAELMVARSAAWGVGDGSSVTQQQQQETNPFGWDSYPLFRLVRPHYRASLYSTRRSAHHHRPPKTKGGGGGGDDEVVVVAAGEEEEEVERVAAAAAGGQPAAAAIDVEQLFRFADGVPTLPPTPPFLLLLQRRAPGDASPAASRFSRPPARTPSAPAALLGWLRAPATDLVSAMVFFFFGDSGPEPLPCPWLRGLVASAYTSARSAVRGALKAR
ncbi:hypothetical protein F4780DRAFT_791886 [Xylariomycetidae sp. FL0641]|nr:hypothetical protein F4780DRAFT_791886 [Xylariomycetidae sp. FL0641]